ncbi:MAG TPA: Amuc_1100 family pilus-like protein [Opitutaceae bacterium]|nr:Amuc_1100 family pilus-like protein [Opitutaceae bacterium]
MIETLTAEAVDLRAQILGGETESTAVQQAPVERTDLFFELARFVDQMRHRCGELGISFRESEYFGFASYAEAGPEKEFVKSVARQRRAVEGLLGELFHAKPVRFEGLRRERPVSVAQQEKSPDKRTVLPTSTSRDGSAVDFFTLDSAMSLRKSGNVDTLAFRLSFAGETSVLRTFLNRLAGAEEPWWVRQVEVATDPASDRASLAPTIPLEPVAPGDKQAEPAIDRGISLFVVTVERIEKIGPRSPSSPNE